MSSPRTLSWDWYPGTIPDNVVMDDTAYAETTFSFHLFRSEMPKAVEYGKGASTYLGTMFDVGPRGRVRLGSYALVHGARIICDSEIEIGDYALISWNVVLMDTYRLSMNPEQRRAQLQRAAMSKSRIATGDIPARPIRIERNVWIGFDACILPGVTIGEGSVVGAKSVVTTDVPPFTIVAGNPAKLIRKIEPEERQHASQTK